MRAIRFAITSLIVVATLVTPIASAEEIAAGPAALSSCTTETAVVPFKVAPNLPKDISDYTGKTWEGQWVGVGNDFSPMPARLTVIYIDDAKLINIRHTWGSDGSENGKPGDAWIKVTSDGNGGLATPADPTKVQYTFKIVDGALYATRLTPSGIASEATMTACLTEPPTTASAG